MKLIKTSITDFTEFILKSGSSKQTKVRQLTKRELLPYNPAHDFYKKLRESILNLHKSGKPKKELEKIIGYVSDPKKRGKYPALVEKYCRFLGRKKPAWFKPPRGTWKHENLTVRLNPELGLTFNGKHHVIKLHFSDSPVTKGKADLVLTLLKDLPVDDPANTVYCFLDIKNNKLYTSDKVKMDLTPILKGEALNFISLWQHYQTAA